MKKYLVLIFIFLNCHPANAQIQLERSVVANAGFYSSVPGLKLDQTIGELVATTKVGTGLTVTNGYQQPEPTFVGVFNITDDANISIYPNPFFIKFNIDIALNIDANIQISIRDLSGKILYVRFNVNTANIRSNLEFDMEKLAAGAYHLIIINTDDGQVITGKTIIKM